MILCQFADLSFPTHSHHHPLRRDYPADRIKFKHITIHHNTLGGKHSHHNSAIEKISIDSEHKQFCLLKSIIRGTEFIILFSLQSCETYTSFFFLSKRYKSPTLKTPSKYQFSRMSRNQKYLIFFHLMQLWEKI